MHSMNNGGSAHHHPMFKYEAVSPVICSKLDLEEQKMRESRLNGSYVSDDSDSEDVTVQDERRRERLLLIANGPPCAIEKSPRKLKFLKHFGLTTNEIRSEIDHERKRKRRKIYRERSVSPVIVEDNERQTSPLRIPHHISQDSLNREKDYQFKAYFLYPLGLEAVTAERRREMEIIRHACEREKQRRLKLKPEPKPPKANSTDLNGHTPSQKALPSATSSGGGVKRKHSEMENSSPTGSSSEPTSRISLGQLQERHPATQVPSQHGAAPPTTAQSARPLAENRAIIFPQDSRDPKRRISKEFAQEFHESVLQTTRQQQEIARHQGRPDEVRYHIGDRSQSGPRTKIVKEEPLALSSDGQSGSDVPPDTVPRARPSSSANNTPPLRWPGIEAIMEAYQQHLQEHREEKNVLQDQCKHLKSKNIELNKLAEHLSARMSELLASKSRADDERATHQSAIDGLKRCLKFLR